MCKLQSFKFEPNCHWVDLFPCTCFVFTVDYFLSCFITIMWWKVFTDWQKKKTLVFGNLNIVCQHLLGKTLKRILNHGHASKCSFVYVLYTVYIFSSLHPKARQYVFQIKRFLILWPLPPWLAEQVNDNEVILKF